MPRWLLLHACQLVGVRAFSSMASKVHLYRGACEPPLEKYFSTDAPHGFCGETCMDPAAVATMNIFEPNLTKARTAHPCRTQFTPDNSRRYTDYVESVTHGFPGFTVSLDLYAPTDMPDHSCCWTQEVETQPATCFGIPGRPEIWRPYGTGPFCCPRGATLVDPCHPDVVSLGHLDPYELGMLLVLVSPVLSVLLLLARFAFKAG